jgi:hypothetical protein
VAAIGHPCRGTAGAPGDESDGSAEMARIVTRRILGGS